MNEKVKIQNLKKNWFLKYDRFKYYLDGKHNGVKFEIKDKNVEKLILDYNFFYQFYGITERICFTISSTNFLLGEDFLGAKP